MFAVVVVVGGGGPPVQAPAPLENYMSGCKTKTGIPLVGFVGQGLSHTLTCSTDCHGGNTELIAY